MKVRKTFARRGLAGVAAVALGVTGLAALSGVAMAADLPDGVVAEGPGQAHAPTSGSLTLYKYEKEDGVGGQTATGLQTDDPQGKPLAGIEFSMWQAGRVNASGVCEALDINVEADWNLAKNSGGVTGTAPGALCAFGDANVRTTGSDGSLEYSGLELGFYYVEETGTGNNNVAEKTAPFVVAIPTPFVGGGDDASGWIYDVHVYPKNKLNDDQTKTVEPGSNTSGQPTLDWTITTPVPKHEDEDLVEGYVYDNLGDCLEYSGGAVVKINGDVVVQPSDYVETYDAGTNTIKWDFEEYLGNINANKAKDYVIEITFKTTVSNTGACATGGTVENPWSPEIGEPGYGMFWEWEDGETETGTDGPTPGGAWGQIQITKTDTDDNPLSGAVFEVYTTGENGTCDPAGNLVTTGTSGADGVVVWDLVDGKLWLATWDDADEKPTADPIKANFCVLETKAPAGYAAVDGYIEVEVEDGLTTVVDGKFVPNVKKEMPTLPLTGAAGTLLLILGGAGVLAIAIGGHLVVSNRKKQNA